MLAPQIDAIGDDPLFELGIAGREYYREAAGELKSATGIDIQLFEAGILRLARGAEEAERLRASVAWQRQRGHHCDWLDPTEVRSDWPWVVPTDGAIWAPRDGAVNPAPLVEALRADARRLGAEFATDTIQAVELQGGSVVAVRGSTRHAGGAVVLAAGAWSGRLTSLPRPVSVEPVKGHMLALPWPEPLPPAIVYGTGAYIVSRAGEAVCGSTMEHAGFSTEVVPETVEAIRCRVVEMAPVLGSGRVLRSWTGLRPGTPDGLPIVGREPGVTGLWYATGHGRNGILLAGITGVVLGHLMDGEATFEEVAALRPERFWNW